MLFSKVPFGQRYRTSREIFGQAWQLIRAERGLWRFPIASGLLFVGMLIGLGVLGNLAYRADWDVAAWAPVRALPPQLFAVVLIPAMIVLSIPLGYVGALLNSAYAFGLHERLNGRDCTPAQAWRRALDHKGTILRFTMLGALVGGVLAILGQLLDKLRLVPWVGTALQAIGTYAWAVAAFFVVPIVVIERETSAVGALRKSVALARDTWGRSTAAIVTISLALMVPMMAFVLVATLGMTAVMFLGITGALPFALAMAYFVGIMLAMLLAMGLMMVFSQAATVAYQVALYSTTRSGIVPLPFTPETLVDPWTPYRNK